MLIMNDEEEFPNKMDGLQTHIDSLKNQLVDLKFKHTMDLIKLKDKIFKCIYFPAIFVISFMVFFSVKIR